MLPICSRRWLFAALAAVIALACLGACAWAEDAPRLPDGVRQSMDAAVAAVKPALVRIQVVAVDYEEGREVKMEEAGSGVIIRKDGCVITNHHVAGKAKQLVCTLANKEEVEADLIGTDAMADLAVLKLRGAGREFPFAEFGDSSKVNVGDYVLAMGSPLALSQSVTRGIVSNTEMIMPEMLWMGSVTLDGEDVGSLVRWIGHDAQIFPGNSGGPLVDLQGRIIGINEISLGLGGAIPSNMAKQIADELIAKRKVTRSWLGVEIQPLLKSSGLQKGVLVGGVIDGSPAAKAGVLPGDVLLRIDGAEIVARYPEQIPIVNQTVSALPVGKEVEVVVLRGGKEQPLKAVMQERESFEVKPAEVREWGICASDLSFFMAREMKRKDRSGALVRSIRPGGAASEAKPDVQEDDVITEVNGRPIKSVADLRSVTREITQGQSEPVATLVSFDRRNERYLTVVKVGARNLEDPGLEVRKAWLPISSQVITEDLAGALGIPGKTGVRVTQVYAGSAAETAGLRVGDLIVALDGEEIPASQPEDTEVLPSMIRNYKIGSKAELTVLRGKEDLKVSVTLPESPKLAREMRKYRDDNFEFTCRDVAFMDRARESWKAAQQGVLVEEVGEGSWAALGRLSVGDLIITVDDQPITNLNAFQAAMKRIAATKPKAVTLQVLRGIHKLYVELRTTWDVPTPAAKSP